MDNTDTNKTPASTLATSSSSTSTSTSTTSVAQSSSPLTLLEAWEKLKTALFDESNGKILFSPNENAESDYQPLKHLAQVY